MQASQSVTFSFELVCNKIGFNIQCQLSAFFNDVSTILYTLAHHKETPAILKNSLKLLFCLKKWRAGIEIEGKSSF